ncbi:hypothetical protein Glove_177g56 [Diversispora epigaea]|uniref:Uncharacterized protein n=1 Tax=Diversispora epigaea TaxID=1348612 RepID=A0A397IR89_9GLOM|nr:hypothetical protein Glove_177g56 [Diversispora epigaea]
MSLMLKGTDEFIAGFNPLAWRKTKIVWMNTNKNFIFSFKDENSILSRVKNDYYTLWYPYNKDKYVSIFEHYDF